MYVKSQKGEIFRRKIYKEKKILKNEQLRIASGDHINLGSKNASVWSSPKGFKNCFRNAPINYRQTMPDDRCTLVKMSITRSRNHDYKWQSYKMSLKRMSWILQNYLSVSIFFLVTQGSAAHLHNMT